MKDETTALPKDLAGYQEIAFGTVRADDIICCSPFAFPRDSMIVHEGSFMIGKDVECANARVYRKSACPKQSDGKEGEVGVQGGTISYCVNPPDVKPKAETYDDGKDPLAYLPWDGVRAVSRVQAYGHRKYKDYNNFRKGMEVGRNLSCALRHIASYMEGESNDPESKESHLAHAACRLLFVLQNEHDKTAIDDRFKK